MDQVSTCCESPVVVGVHYEYPLNSKKWHEAYKIDVCEECGKECDTIYTCGMCGLVTHDEMECQV